MDKIRLLFCDFFLKHSLQEGYGMIKFGQVTAYDEAGVIGKGTHKRVIVNSQKFLDKANSKL